MKTSLLKTPLDQNLFNKQYNQIKPITNQLVSNINAPKSATVVEPIKKPSFVMAAALKAQKWAISLDIKALEDFIMQQKIGIGVAVRCEKKRIPYLDSVVDLQKQLADSYEELSILNNRLRDINLQLNCK